MPIKFYDTADSIWRTVTATQIPGSLYFPTGTDWTRVHGPVTEDFVLGVTKPSATNTGAGLPGRTALTAHSGDYTVTSGVAGNRNVTGRVIVDGTNVYIYNVKAAGVGTSPTASNGFGLFSNKSTNTGTVFEHCTGNPTTPAPGWEGIKARAYTAIRCHFTAVVDAFWVAYSTTAAPTILRGNYVHGLSGFTGTSTYTGHSDGYTHNDAAQLHGGLGIIVDGNFFDARWGNKADVSRKNIAALMLNHNTGNLEATIRNNWFDGGEVCINGMGLTDGDTIRLDGNRFGPNVTTNRDYVVRIATAANLIVDGVTIPKTAGYTYTSTTNVYGPDSPLAGQGVRIVRG